MSCVVHTPFIDLERLLPDTDILMETENAIWELHTYEWPIVLVQSTAMSLKKRWLKAVFHGSIYDGVYYYNLIMQGCPFDLGFSDMNYLTRPVLSARVSTDKWHYDVF